MVLFCISSEFYSKKGSKIPGSGQIATKMHGISFAVGAPPQTPLWGLISPPLSGEGRGIKGKGRRGKERGKKGEG